MTGDQRLERFSAKCREIRRGFVRLRNRRERRSELPIEPLWKFYSQLTWEVIVKHLRVAAEAWRIFRIYRRVAAGAHIPYTDHAMTPVSDDQTQRFELFTNNKSARDAVDHARKIKILTALTSTASAIAGRRSSFRALANETNVCCWHLANIQPLLADVRFRGKADIATDGQNVCF